MFYQKHDLEQLTRNCYRFSIKQSKTECLKSSYIESSTQKWLEIIMISYWMKHKETS